jgi:K+/H+ antiporter YhaU regulatory subunit KhtT
VRAHYGVIVVAIDQGDGEMEFNPPASHTIHAGDTLVVIGKRPDLEKLENDCSSR